MMEHDFPEVWKIDEVGAIRKQINDYELTRYSVEKEVRKAIGKIGGTIPEDLPTPEKSIEQIEKEKMERLKTKAKAGS